MSILGGSEGGMDWIAHAYCLSEDCFAGRELAMVLQSGSYRVSPGLYHTVLDGLIQIQPSSRIPKSREGLAQP